jgi:hypothetical protein
VCGSGLALGLTLWVERAEWNAADMRANISEIAEARGVEVETVGICVVKGNDLLGVMWAVYTRSIVNGWMDLDESSVIDERKWRRLNYSMSSERSCRRAGSLHQRRQTRPAGKSTTNPKSLELYVGTKFGGWHGRTVRLWSEYGGEQK